MPTFTSRKTNRLRGATLLMIAVGLLWATERSRYEASSLPSSVSDDLGKYRGQ